MVFHMHIIFNRVLAMHLDVNVSLCAVVTVTISVNLFVLPWTRAVLFCYILKQRNVTGIKSSENCRSVMRLRSFYFSFADCCSRTLSHRILTHLESSDVNSTNVMVLTSEVGTVLTQFSGRKSGEAWN